VQVCRCAGGGVVDDSSSQFLVCVVDVQVSTEYPSYPTTHLPYGEYGVWSMRLLSIWSSLLCYVAVTSRLGAVTD
jgi:hypothetical protein